MSSPFIVESLTEVLLRNSDAKTVHLSSPAERIIMSGEGIKQ